MTKIPCGNCYRSIFFNDADIWRGIKLYCPFCHAEMLTHTENDQSVDVGMELQQLIDYMNEEPKRFAHFFMGAYRAAVTRSGLRKQMIYEDMTWEELFAKLRTQASFHEFYKKLCVTLWAPIDMSASAHPFAEAVMSALIVAITDKHIGYTTVFNMFPDRGDSARIVDGFCCIRHIAEDYIIRMLEEITPASRALTAELADIVRNEDRVREYIWKYYSGIPETKAAHKSFTELMNRLQMREAPSSFWRDMAGAAVRDRSSRIARESI